MTLGCAFGQIKKIDSAEFAKLTKIVCPPVDLCVGCNLTHRPEGLYVQTEGLYRFEIKLKGSGQKGKAVFTKGHFETRTTKYHGNWVLRQDTIIIMYKNNCVATHKFFYNDTCLFNVDKKNCVYMRTPKQK